MPDECERHVSRVSGHRGDEVGGRVVLARRRAGPCRRRRRRDQRIVGGRTAVGGLEVLDGKQAQDAKVQRVFR